MLKQLYMVQMKLCKKILKQSFIGLVYANVSKVDPIELDISVLNLKDYLK